MADRTLSIKLEGKSQLHEPKVVFEDLFSINLFSLDGGVTWRNDGVTIPVQGTLEILMSCKAITGTGWSFTVSDKNTSSKVCEVSGHTGDPMPHRNNQRKANFSEFKLSF